MVWEKSKGKLSIKLKKNVKCVSPENMNKFHRQREKNNHYSVFLP